MKDPQEQEALVEQSDCPPAPQAKKTNAARKQGKKISNDTNAETAALALASLGVAAGAIPVISTLPLAASVLCTLVARYRALPVNKKTEPVDVVSETWKDRPKANMVKWLMQHSDTSLETVAAYLGCSTNYLNNKLTRDSFSFDDLILVAYACGYTFVLTDNNEEVKSANSYRVDLLNYFANSDSAALERVFTLGEKKQEAMREEYEKKKAELARIREEYGFEE